MMRYQPTSARKLLLPVLIGLLVAMGSARADERGDLEQLRATTMSLIEALVESGVLPREKADKLVQEAEAKARQRLAENPPTPQVGKDGKKIVRVAYVPESMKQEIREQVKYEVLAQAKNERWGDPGALPSWLDRIQFEGDLRLRYDFFQLDKGNTAAGGGRNDSNGTTRGADLVVANGTISGTPNTNTQDDFNRWRVRARLAANVKVADWVSGGIRIATGTTTGPTSTNQTLGQNLNKYSLVLDRAFLTLKPNTWLSLTGGRFANPFFGTDLVWADDLNFEGVALNASSHWTPELGGFFNAGWFPLRADNPLQTTSRTLTGIQGGVNWQPSGNIKIKVGAAMYNYDGIVGQQETVARYGGGVTATDYGTRYEYPASMRQRGNTLFILNVPLIDVTQPTYWGLASGFREFNLTGSLDIANFDPTHIVLTGDFVKNTAFDRAKISARTGTAISDGRNYGYLGKVLVGNPHVENEGDWNASLSYRWLGSDAVLDAFTNSDFGLGGTNNKGFIFGFNYGLAKNTWLSTRWMSSDLIDSMAPKLNGTTTAPTKLSVDLLQIDLNAKF